MERIVYTAYVARVEMATHTSAQNTRAKNCERGKLSGRNKQRHFKKTGTSTKQPTVLSHGVAKCKNILPYQNAG